MGNKKLLPMIREELRDLLLQEIISEE